MTSWGGGFFRYSIDPGWQLPHFEKMLYDNALLSSLYLEAANIFNLKKFASVAKDTLDFMITTLRADEGAYIASLSAIDNNAVEGGYYLWQVSELKKFLTKDEFQLIELIWQLEGVAELKDGHHLVNVMTDKEASMYLKLSFSKTRILLDSAKKKMQRLRSKRNLPKDDKLLAGWNGLALSAFSKAARQFNDNGYGKAATEIKNYIYHTLWHDNALARAVKKGQIIKPGELEDYAFVAQGLYDWIEYSGNKVDEKWLNRLLMQAWQRFYDKDGWLLAQNMLLKYARGEVIIADTVLPSSSAVLIETSLKYANKSNNSRLKVKALRALNEGHSKMRTQPFWYASQILVLYKYQVED